MQETIVEGYTITEPEPILLTTREDPMAKRTQEQSLLKPGMEQPKIS